MHRSLAVIALVVGGAAAAAQQPQTPPADTGAIVGKVLDGSTNQPLSGVTVSIFAGGKSQSILSDDQGRFAFSDLPADARSLQARMLGYVGGAYGQTTAAGGGATFEFKAGLKLTDVTLRLWKGGVMTGRVLDDHGDPLIGVAVQALRRRVAGGYAQAGARGGDAATDDQGQFRITGLTPGMYTLALPSGNAMVLVRISLNQSGSRPATPTGLPAVFFPGVFDVETARFLPVEAAAEVAAGDFRVPTASMFTISGRLTGLEAVPTTLKIHLLSIGVSTRPSAMDVWTTTPKADGSFGFSRVAPGQYLIRAMVFPKSAGAQQMGSTSFTVPNGSGPMPQLTDDPTYWADAIVTVDAKNIDDLVLPFLHGAPIGGRVVFDGTTAAPAAEVLGRMPVLVQSADGRPLDSFQLATVKSDLTFKTVGLPAGAYGVVLMSMIGALLPSPWSLQSMTVGGREVSGSSFSLGPGGVNDLVITMTDRPAELSGVVTAGGQPKPRASVYVFPADRRLWTDYADGFSFGRLITVAANDAGAYKFGGLLPGAYLVAASVGVAPDDWKLADSLDALAKSAVTVTIAAHEKKTLDLTAR